MRKISIRTIFSDLLFFNIESQTTLLYSSYRIYFYIILVI